MFLTRHCIRSATDKHFFDGIDEWTYQVVMLMMGTYLVELVMNKIISGGNGDV